MPPKLNTFTNINPSTVDINRKQAYGYIRVSDPSQVERSSLFTQQKVIMKYAEENNLELLDVFKDEGKSGLTTVDRDGFVELIKNVKPYNWVIVYELSRLARDQADLINTFRDLVRNKNCTFICLNPFIDSRTEQADLMVGIMSSIAQEESKRISIRVTSNMKRLSEEGKLICRPPFGYMQDPTTRHFLKDAEQQEVIQQLQIWYLTGVSMNEMAKRLNNEGKAYMLNNNKKKKIADPKFTASTISSILHGYGIIQDNKTPKFTYHQRVENWNNSIHKTKIKRDISDTNESEPQIST